MSHEPGPRFAELLAIRLDRRRLLQTGLVAAGAAALAPVLGACSPSRSEAAGPARGSGVGRPLRFSAITSHTDDRVVVPDGYSAATLVRWGDPLRPELSEFDPDTMSPADQGRRFGFNCDFLAVLPLPDSSRRSDRGLLWVNHESTDEKLMFTQWSKTPEQVGVAMAAHGGSLIEVRGGRDGRWSYDPASPFNRRITGITPIRIAGPATGYEWMRTRDDPSGSLVLGMLGNCAGGVTPWRTILTAEENFDHYFVGMDRLQADDTVKRAHGAYITRANDRAEHGWERYHRRFDVSQEPNEPFRFGWIVEVDPYDPTEAPKKRTALGRFKHEGAVTVLSGDGRPVVYSGDDEALQHVYKFVGSEAFREHGPGGNRDLLDDGTLYAARFEADGRGSWLPLTFGSGPLVPKAFTSQADVLIRARQAALALGATQMDRPEDIEVHPSTGRVYLSMTKNKDRGLKGNRVDAANPRPGNAFGHVIELIEDGDDAAATRFRWEIFLLCGNPRDLVRDLNAADFSGPDGYKKSYFATFSDPSRLSPIATPDNLVFDDAGHLWIATDGQEALTDADVKANDALHAVPTDGPERGRVQQFLSAPAGAEVTGPCFSPDCRTLFVSIQHPGKDGKESHWPDLGESRPRPSVVVVTKDDGGPIGT